MTSTASAPTNPDWLEKGSKDTGAGQNSSTTTSPYGWAFSSLPLWLFPFITFFLMIPIPLFSAPLLNVYILNYPLYSHKMLFINTPNGSHCTTDPFVTDISAKKTFKMSQRYSECKEPWSFSPRQIQAFTWVCCFLLSFLKFSAVPYSFCWLTLVWCSCW